MLTAAQMLFRKSPLHTGGEEVPMRSGNWNIWGLVKHVPLLGTERYSMILLRLQGWIESRASQFDIAISIRRELDSDLFGMVVGVDRGSDRTCSNMGSGLAYCHSVMLAFLVYISRCCSPSFAIILCVDSLLQISKEQSHTTAFTVQTSSFSFLDPI